MVSILKCTKFKKTILAPNNMLKSDNLNKLFPKETYSLMSNSTPDVIFIYNTIVIVKTIFRLFLELKVGF